MSAVSGQVQGCVGEGRVPGEEPDHHRERGALEQLGPALHWLEERLGAGLAGPRSFSLVYTSTEPVFIFGIFLGVHAEPGYNCMPSFFKTRNLCKLETV